MSNRKESIKKSLGLTEYPWSSDDEETQSPSQAASTTNRRPPENPEARSSATVGTSVAGIIPSVFPIIRTQAKLERELFLSLLNNHKRMVSADSSRPSTSSYEPPPTTEPIDLDSPVSNMQRIYAIKRLTTRTLNTNGYPRSTYPVTSTAHNASGRQAGVRARRRRALPTCGRTSIIPAVMDGGSAAQDLQEDEAESPERSLLQDNVESNENVDEQQSNDANTTAAVGISEAEEVVEIDADTDANQPDEAIEENQEQASGDEDHNEETALITVPDEAPAVHGVKRKRENQDLEPSTVKEFNQSLLRLLECPVCLEWMEPPMAQCRRGHLVCGRCRARLAACPVCRTTFSSVRNRAMEAVAELLRYPCRHGCGRETRLRGRAPHEADCPARRYRCPAPPCADRAPLALADLPLHFQTRHLSILKMGRRHRFSMKVNTEQHDHWLVMAARELFHLRVDVDIRTWGVDVYVAYIGPKCNAPKYTYEVTVLGQHNDRKLVYTRATHSDLESSSLNVSRQDCFHLTLDQALNFLRFKNRHCEPDKFLDFVVEINKSEAPADAARLDPGS